VARIFGVGRMKVGDLVKFSAYGKRLQCNRDVASYDPIGVVIKSGTWFQVSWCGLGELFQYGYRRKYCRQDLKYAK